MQLDMSGHPLHTRSLTVVIETTGEARWRVRGEIIDLRKCSFVPMVADLQPAGIVHHMRIELDVDPSAHRIEAVEVDQPVVAIEPSPETGGECCRDPAPRLQRFAGVVLDDDFTKGLSAGFGGPRGCSHLLTLFQLMASATRRAFRLEEEETALLGCPRRAGERLFRRSVFVDGMDRNEGEIGLAVQMSDFLTRPSELVKHPLQRLAREDSVRVMAVVQRPQMLLRGIRGAERSRSGETVATADWTSRDDALQPFDGAPAFGGLAPRLLGSFGQRVEDELLLATMLQVAPGHIQVLATTMERFFGAQRSDDSPTNPTGAAGAAGGHSIGGMADSCYMWREDGPSIALRRDLAGAPTAIANRVKAPSGS